MKHRTSLVLMEQLVMVLTFALAAALCLGLFAKAGEISEQTARLDDAVLLAQSAAELLKSGEDPEKTLQTGDYTLYIAYEDTPIPDFAQGKITVLYHGEAVYTLRTGWQEVGE